MPTSLADIVKRQKFKMPSIPLVALPHYYRFSNLVKSNQLNLVFDPSLDSLPPEHPDLTTKKLSIGKFCHQTQTHIPKTEYNMIQNPIGCFLCLICYFINGHYLHQVHFIKYDCMGIITSLMIKTDPELIDVNVLMATHFLIESIQNQQQASTKELLQLVYNEFIFEFSIWSQAPFQVTIGYIQYIRTIIKVDQNYFK